MPLIPLNWQETLRAYGHVRVKIGHDCWLSQLGAPKELHHSQISSWKSSLCRMSPNGFSVMSITTTTHWDSAFIRNSKKLTHSLRYNIGVFFVTFAGKNDDVSWRINNLEYEMGKRMTRKRARVACFMGHLARNCVRESAYLKDSFFLFLNDDRSLQGIVSIILACTNFILSSDHAKNSEYRYVKKVEG